MKTGLKFDLPIPFNIPLRTSTNESFKCFGCAFYLGINIGYRNGLDSHFADRCEVIAVGFCQQSDYVNGAGGVHFSQRLGLVWPP